MTDLDTSETIENIQSAPEPPRPTVYEVKEYERVEIPASDLMRNGTLTVYASVVQHGYFTVRPGTGPLQLQAGGYIGIIPLNDQVTIDVRSRVPVSNLSRVLRLSDEVPVPLEGSTRFYEEEPDLYPSLVDLYARALADYVGEIAVGGLIREYRRREEVTSFPRGRFLMDATLKSLTPRGITHKAVTTFFERTSDNPANRCLKYAVWLLGRLRRNAGSHQPTSGSRDLDRGLNRAYRAFDGVTLDLARSFLGDATVTGRRPLPAFRSYYRRPLDLALAIIRQHAVTLDGAREELVMPSLVLNMGNAFESYLRNVLVTQAQQRNWMMKVLDGNHAPPGGGSKPLFDTGVNMKATPDIVIAEGPSTNRSHPLLIEVKYKPANNMNRDDLNQVLAYGASYGCSDVILAQPRGARGIPSSGLHRLGSIGDMDVHQYVFDLNADDIEGEENGMAVAVSGLFPQKPEVASDQHEIE